MYVKFPGKLVTCISYENYVYRTKSDKRYIHVGTELSQIKGTFMLCFFLSF